MKTNLYFSLIISVCLMICQMAVAQTNNYFSGTSAGASNTTGDYNAFAGYGAGISNTAGSLNTAFGFYAGASNQATNYNTFMGAYAGYYTSSSLGQNVFVGYRAGLYNSNGFYNVFLGSDAGLTNNAGSYNIFIGASAGYDNTSGLSNTFIGYASGSNNTTASANTFVGNLSGFSNTSGANNSFFGSGSGTSNTTGTNNAIFGSGAGYYSNASDNTFLGYYAGRNNSSGYSNVFVGRNAGLNTTTGYNNTFLGRGAGENNSTARENTFIGNTAGKNTTTGIANTSLGFAAGPSSATLSNATAVGHRSQVTASNAIVLGSIAGINGAANSVKVGIGVTAPGYTIHVNGSAGKPGGGSWTAASDKRLKHHIQDFTEGLTIIEQIRPVSFHYNGKAGLPTEKEYVGVIAQEMKLIAPYMVGEFTYQDSTGAQEKYLDYDATALTYMLVNAVKELKKENEELKQELASIKELLVKYIPQAGNEQARLGQNNPNPYTQSTSIPYQLPTTTKTAFIKVYSSTGQEVKSFDVSGKTNGEVTLLGSMLAAGTYVYSLFVDGVKIDSKKLVLTP
jgi:trimeric autotransporter adhesin